MALAMKILKKWLANHQKFMADLRSFIKLTIFFAVMLVSLFLLGKFANFINIL